MKKVDTTIIFSLFTRPLIVSLVELLEWGTTREEIEKELRYALTFAEERVRLSSEKAEAGH